MQTVLTGDTLEQLKSLPNKHFHAIVTSPPYWKCRKYTDDPREIGNEPIHEDYILNLEGVFAVCHDKLRDDGTLWVNIGSFTSASELVYHLAGLWSLTSDVIWHKPNPVTRFPHTGTLNAHEYVLAFSKRSKKSYVNPYGLHDGTKYSRSVWTLSVGRSKQKHFAQFPPTLPERCLKLSTNEMGCCPSCGAQFQVYVTKERIPTRPGRNTKYEGVQSKVCGNHNTQRHITKITGGPFYREGCDCGIVVSPCPDFPSDDITMYGCTTWPASAPCRVLDPFCGACTTLKVAERLKCDSWGIDLNPITEGLTNVIPNHNETL